MLPLMSLEPEQELRPLMTAEEVATALRVSEQTVWRWAREGKLPAVRVSRTTRFRHEDMEKLMGADADA